jgi:hypothetical protein
MNSMRHAIVLLAIATALAAPGARGADEPAGDALVPEPPADEPRTADVRTIAGKIAVLRWNDGRFTLEAADGPVSIRVDRNTMVLLEARTGTLRDLTVGLPVRTSVRGPDNLAAFVEIRQRGIAPTPAREPATADTGKPDLVKDPAGNATGTPAPGPATPAGPPGGAGTDGAPPTSAPVPPSPESPGPTAPSPAPPGTGTPR